MTYRARTHSKTFAKDKLYITGKELEEHKGEAVKLTWLIDLMLDWIAEVAFTICAIPSDGRKEEDVGGRRIACGTTSGVLLVH
uniref:Uncharacterized protein n=1 Tax=Lutzomyia longipalpis TaxID=7200 RepID=A0A1B0CHH8_LUTLO